MRNGVLRFAEPFVHRRPRRYIRERARVARFMRAMTAMPDDRTHPPDTQHVTQLLQRVSAGDRKAYSDLLPLVYDHLKDIAAGRLQWERDGHTLSPTALVHEAYLKLVHQDRVEWKSRSHFYAVASQAMRRILIDYAKARRRGKRGGREDAIPLDLVGDVADGSHGETLRFLDLLALDEALTKLSAENSRAADIVQYRFFGGLTNHEIADVLGISEVTVRRSWTLAKMWLRRALEGQVESGSAFLGGDDA